MKLPSDPFLTVQAVCRMLGLVQQRGDRTIHLRHAVDNAISDGRLRAYCISRGQRKRKLVIDPRDLAKFLESCEFKPGRRRG
jgi:hypothetical protein